MVTNANSFMDPNWVPGTDPGAEESAAVYRQLDSLRARHEAAEATEEGRKQITLRMRLRDVARAQGLARKLDVKYQTLLQELIADGLSRKEAELGLVPRGVQPVPTATEGAAVGRAEVEHLRSQFKELMKLMAALMTEVRTEKEPLEARVIQEAVNKLVEVAMVKAHQARDTVEQVTSR